MLGKKKGFIQWSKNGEEGSLLANQLLDSSRGLKGYRYRIGTVRERQIKGRNIHVISGTRR